MSYIPGNSSSGSPAPSTDFEIDFASLADAGLVDGWTTIGGQSFVVQNKANAGTFAIQSGTGLYIKANTGIASHVGGNWTVPAIVLPIAGIAGMTMPTDYFIKPKDVWVLWNIVPVTTPAIDYDGFICGGAFSDRAYPGYATPSIMFDTDKCYKGRFFNYHNSGNGSHFSSAALGNATSGPDEWYGDGSETVTADVMAIKFDMESKYFFLFYGNMVGAAFPALTALTGAFGYCRSPAQINMKFRYAAAFAGITNQNTNATADVLIKKVKVLHTAKAF